MFMLGALSLHFLVSSEFYNQSFHTQRRNERVQLGDIWPISSLSSLPVAGQYVESFGFIKTCPQVKAPSHWLGLQQNCQTVLVCFLERLGGKLTKTNAPGDLLGPSLL